ncbi:proteolipid protein 2 isoform X2 [Astyanax mexicanus]|uniref:proteolipid protein 2 isoform X2 n=1 Tax=Astyanax mexicanus TaxID=7994 RepID=UPI0020CAA445|nr:proteolipid protein 2 isoform X2 [Astyanax mexicanus]
MAEEAAPQNNTMQKMIDYTTSTRKGGILMAEIVLSIIVVICFAVSVFGYYILAGVWELISTIIIFIIFSLELQTTFRFINFQWTVFGFLASLLYGHDTYLILTEIRASKDSAPVMIASI